MMAAPIRKRDGFTLVELAIVLVIIGLLIGGILVAQSMISTARIAATVSQIQQFDGGVMNFKTKYASLPGDSLQFGGPGLGYLAGQYNDPTIMGGSIATFWNNIDSTQFPGTCNFSCLVYTTGPNKNVPMAKMGKANSFFIASVLTDPTTYSIITPAQDYYAILDDPSQVAFFAVAGVNCFTTSSASNSPVKPSDLLALDKKMDDGIANTGNVLSGSIANLFTNRGYGAIQAIPYSYATSSCSNNSGVYQVQNSTHVCTPLICIGAQAGDPQ